MPRVAITERGEVPLPAAVRKRRHLEPGARVVLTERDHDNVLSPDPHQAIDRAMGCLMKGSFKSWDLTKQELEQLPIEVVSTDKALAEQAGLFKARGGVSLADRFAAALAQREGTFLWTGDPEFKRLEKDIRIKWI